MPTWEEIASEFGTHAAKCARSGIARTATSRAYYSLFATVTHALAARKVPMFHGTNPRHRDLPRHIKRDLGLAPASSRRLVSLARSLYDRRLDADYNGVYVVDERTARESLRDMAEAKVILRRDE
jgi:uncharacterized protein (UPF0332 family)